MIIKDGLVLFMFVVSIMDAYIWHRDSLLQLIDGQDIGLSSGEME